ncbi:MAG: hypothetical protein DIZ80_00245 [endosymbiont of Galathealinum brachiosum]|uniref:Uncharacterized protein n=1 Tax=endosymbiont of Galathealinum brachiosum TaxID=2200906 RepID=A0A370DM05_9GAMM|nr:MAG: hypothetical protein DIZ80_00245 [endosymbiont of Galathealinum brachiosum]
MNPKPSLSWLLKQVKLFENVYMKEQGKGQNVYYKLKCVYFNLVSNLAKFLSFVVVLLVGDGRVASLIPNAVSVSLAPVSFLVFNGVTRNCQ